MRDKIRKKAKKMIYKENYINMKIRYKIQVK